MIPDESLLNPRQPSEVPSGHAATPVTRRRGEALLRAIRHAVLLELGEYGYSAFRIEGVAARAHTGKASIYRRWSDKDQLILDTLRGGVPSGPPPRYSGDLRSDLIDMLTGMADGLQSPFGPAFRALLAETHRRPDLLEALHEVAFDPGAAGVRQVLRAAAEAGEIDPALVDGEAATFGHQMTTFRYITTGQVSADEIVSIVDQMWLPALRYTPRPSLRQGSSRAVEV